MRAEIWTAGLVVVLLVMALTARDGGDSAAVDADEVNLSRREVLGKRLFFDASLSTPPGQSCASCHDAEKAFSGNNGSSAGVALWADGRSLGLRNTPTAMYARFAPPFAVVDEEDGPTPIGGQFLDGRAASLEDQARQPFFTRDEMNVESPAVLVARVSHAGYADLFLAEWGADIFDNNAAAMEAIKASIGAFERTERFAPFSSKYDHVVSGLARFTDDEKRGLDLFMDPEKGNCAACHVADPASKNLADSLFTDFTYDNLGVPRNRRIPANNDPTFFDLGLCGPKRAPPDGNKALCGAFKVPTLRNVDHRVALMHNGIFTSLRDVVAFYVTRDTDPGRWYPGAIPFDDLPAKYHDNVNRTEVPYDRKPGEAPRLNAAEIDAVVSFLHTLTDCYGESLARYADPTKRKSSPKAHALVTTRNPSVASSAIPAPTAGSTTRRRQ